MSKGELSVLFLFCLDLFYLLKKTKRLLFLYQTCKVSVKKLNAVIFQYIHVVLSAILETEQDGIFLLMTKVLKNLLYQQLHHISRKYPHSYYRMYRCIILEDFDEPYYYYYYKLVIFTIFTNKCLIFSTKKQ